MWVVRGILPQEPAKPSREPVRIPREPFIIGLALWPAVLLSALGPGAVLADRWRIQPNTSIATEYTDNVRFSRDNQESAFSATLDATVRATRSTEASNTGIYLGVGATRFPAFSERDNDRGFVGLDLGYRLERQQFRLGARVDSLSTIYSEVATTGLEQVNRQQNSWRVNPGWAFDLTERSTLSLRASYLDVSYDDPASVPLSNYRVGTLSLGGDYRLSERLSLNSAVDYGRYEAQQRLTNETDNMAVTVGASYQRSERSSLDAQVGLRYTEQTVGGPGGGSVTEDSSGQVYRISYSRRFEAGGGLRLQARRELTPSGSSQVLDTTGLLADLNLPLSARWRVGITGDAFRNRSPSGDRGLQDRTYASVAPRLAYEIDEYWRLSAGYRFRWQEREEIPGETVSNAVFLTLNWTRPWDL